MLVNIDIGRLAILSRHMDSMEQSPVVADNVFRDSINDLDEIERIFCLVRADTSRKMREERIDEKFLLFLDSAQEYATVNALFNANRDKDAIAMIDQLVSNRESHDPALAFIEHSLVPIGTSYLSECRKQKKLLTPDEVDKVVFQNYVLPSMSEVPKYEEHDALILVNFDEFGYEARFCPSKLVTEIRENDSTGVTSIVIENVGGVQDIFCETERDFDTDVGACLDNYEIRNPLELVVTNPDIDSYLFNRYLMKRIKQEMDKAINYTCVGLL